VYEVNVDREAAANVTAAEPANGSTRRV
jgi:hypothetical protein